MDHQPHALRSIVMYDRSSMLMEGESRSSCGMVVDHSFTSGRPGGIASPLESTAEATHLRKASCISDHLQGDAPLSDPLLCELIIDKREKGKT